MAVFVRLGVAATVAVGSATACGTEPFVCQLDAECSGGLCEPTGYCSFPDADCPSGRRYGDHAPASVAGHCVVPDAAGTDASTSVASAGTNTSDDPDGSGSETTPLSSGNDSGSTSSPPDGTTTTGPPPGSDSSTTGGIDGVFHDDFDRADAEDIGNGWIEKYPTTWQLVGGEVVFESAALNYEDNVVYRPASEDLLDTEVSIEFVLLAESVDNHPQVHVRIQHDDVEDPGRVTCYLVYVAGMALEITRQTAGAFDGTWSAPLSAEVVVGERYRLSLAVSGTDDVQLDGRLEVMIGGSFTDHTQVIGVDPVDDPGRIVDAGSVGFSGADTDQIANIVYDNFIRRDLLSP